MKMDLGIQMKLSQNLIMTPQLQQAIKLLQLSRHELETLVEQSLIENPTLEITENSDEHSNSENSQEQGQESNDNNSEDRIENRESAEQEEFGSMDEDWSDYIQSGAGQIYEDFKSGNPDEEQNILENTITKKLTLSAYLFNQIDLTFIEDDEREMASNFVNYINEDGYLTASIREIIAMSPPIENLLKASLGKETINLENYNVAAFDEKYPSSGKINSKLQVAKKLIIQNDPNSENKEEQDPNLFVADPDKMSQVNNSLCYVLEQILKKFQRLDPNGIGARNLRECLMIQFEAMEMESTLSYQILKNDFNNLIKNDIQRLHRKYNTSHVNIQDACRLIKELEPKPGRPYNEENTQYIIPDVFIFKKLGKYVVQLNSDTLPNLRVSPYYIEMAKQQHAELLNKKKNKKNDSEDNDEEEDLTGAYLNEKIKAGEWLIKSIDQRQRTIYKVSESILKNQKEFFEKGVYSLKPMILKDVAEDIGVHESTVSRITNNKFALTPQGIFELKYFFTSGITQKDGDTISSKKIKNMIQTLVNQENPKKPYTDNQLAVELEKTEKIKIARRTVAKYRESLNILPSNRRKRLF